MARSSLEKFRARMALTAYFRQQFGVSDPHDPAAVRRFYEELDGVGSGESSEGTSNVYHFLAARMSDSHFTAESLLRYERNVRKHVNRINDRRARPITFKPFQRLAALMAESYLDRLFNRPEAFLANLNTFVEDANDERKGRIAFPRFERSDLNKLAFWMATGSGKTLLMHLNYYQYLEYAGNAGALPENILLITPNEGLSRQHLEKFERSGIAAFAFNAETSDLWAGAENPVKVIEIHKLTAGKGTEEGLSIPVEALEGKNLVFVDEAHKGLASDAQTWVGHREALASQGFTFEYSAAFGHALAGEKVDLEEEYGKTIVFDYSYPRFHQDGYGKDYEILNLKGNVPQDLRDRYLLGNLLAFYQQHYLFKYGPQEYRSEFNIHCPLLVFIGHSVNAGKTASRLTKPDRQSLSDVEEILTFLARVLQDDDGWTQKEIVRILEGSSGLKSQDGSDLFEGALPILAKSGLSAEEIHARLLNDFFRSNAPARLVLDDIKSAPGEIGLRARGSDEPFGVINIGNDQVFLERAERHEPDIAIREDRFSSSLFASVGDPDSPISVLLGARKFIEGWDSWRVSSMGLMNFGRGEGPLIVQLFGRGVRLLGKDRSLKRASALESRGREDDITVLETLRVFGVRADYMTTFKEHLAQEGIDVAEKEKVTIPTQRTGDFENKGLLVIRPDSDRVFEEEERFVLDPAAAPKPTVDLHPRLEVLVSAEDGDAETAEEVESRTIPSVYLPLLDWDRLYKEMWHFRASRGYANIAVPKAYLRRILEDEEYHLYCPDEYLRVLKLEDIREKLEPVALAILRRSVEQYYERRRRSFEKGSLIFSSLDSELNGDDGNFPDEYEVEVEVSRRKLLEELKKAVKEKDRLYNTEEGLPGRVHFDRHLYLPLLAERRGEEDVPLDYHPPALNEGERKFVEGVRDYLGGPDGERLLEAWEVYLLRNRSRGHGIGFLLGKGHDERFYPDFILWLKNGKEQHVVFVEPHGLALEGEPLVNAKVDFHYLIKEYENEISKRTGRTDVQLHSYLVSQTSCDDLLRRSRAGSRNEFHEHGIYFGDDGVQPIFEDVLELTEEE